MSEDYRTDPAWAALFAKPEQAQDLRWGGEHMRFKAADTVRELVTRELIEHWLVFGNLRYPQFNVSYGGDGAPPTTFTRTRVLNQHQLTGCAHADDIIEHLDRGGTLVLSNMEQYDQRVGDFCRGLANAVSGTAQTYAYLTAPDQFGSRPHRDTADVFAVQIEGTKQWTLYDLPTGGDWNRGHIDDDTQVTEKVVLEPGDALYVPAGLGHRAQAGPTGSLHLTISLGVPPVRQVIDVLTEELRAVFQRQEAFPPGQAGRAEVARDALRRLAAAVEAADPAAVADRLVRPSEWPHEARRLPW
ncbi:JmjC domain-containing protein [Actinocrispum wychmicini]|uniref:Cupin superfamily protein n=1 Tax=Actinocrispum wychmicini TaxID=1213861 RepID=A0A4R2JRN2_9PSEU|nr:cupin domain-containing protein [Actinocrispum wychmicini]TCO62194.1 cupin superfamily protein [Actinocrispum wychmicini]